MALFGLFGKKKRTQHHKKLDEYQELYLNRVEEPQHFYLDNGDDMDFDYSDADEFNEESEEAMMDTRLLAIIAETAFIGTTDSIFVPFVVEGYLVPSSSIT